MIRKNVPGVAPLNSGLTLQMGGMPQYSIGHHGGRPVLFAK